MTNDRVASRFHVSATKEVILSAGAIGTPQILMLSGIGPRDTLSSIGVETVVDLPSVGQNLTDHPLVQNHFRVNSVKTFDEVLRNETLAQQTLKQWNATRQGLFGNPSGGILGFIRLPTNSFILGQFGDPSSGPHSAHIEFIFVVSGLSYMNIPILPSLLSRTHLVLLVLWPLILVISSQLLRRLYHLYLVCRILLCYILATKANNSYLF